MEAVWAAARAGENIERAVCVSVCVCECVCVEKNFDL
jgi:hypothetical protein